MPIKISLTKYSLNLRATFTCPLCNFLSTINFKMDALALVVISIKFPLKLRLSNLRALLLSALRNTTLSACAVKIPRSSREKNRCVLEKIHLYLKIKNFSNVCMEF